MKKNLALISQSEWDPLEASKSFANNHSVLEKQERYGALLFINGVCSSQNEQMFCLSTNHGYCTYIRKGENELCLTSETRSGNFEVE